MQHPLGFRLFPGVDVETVALRMPLRRVRLAVRRLLDVDRNRVGGYTSAAQRVEHGVGAGWRKCDEWSVGVRGQAVLPTIRHQLFGRAAPPQAEETPSSFRVV